jgi:hypothetical protein
MEKDDEIIARIMKEETSEYIMDDGFSAGVIKSLPKRRMTPETRRTVLILSCTAVGCVIAMSAMWNDLSHIAAIYGKLMAFVNGMGAIGILYVAAFSVTLSVVLLLAALGIARQENMR